jgi:hypothetical protein
MKRNPNTEIRETAKHANFANPEIMSMKNENRLARDGFHLACDGFAQRMFSNRHAHAIYFHINNN